MATVYLAKDLKHHRQVAIKVLRPDLAAALGSERFLREVELTANLTHPHILGLFDSGEADGSLYYVMPYIEGETLRDRMNREGQLPLDDALQITREVAAALGYAHSRDVIHRDIKPENVLLSAGEAVVADFGIARAITEAGEEHLTETGVSIGTPAYMSPEQASGAHKLDGRSDVYSLGCVLYEMLAGEPPYTGPTAQAVLAKKLSEATPRVSVVRERVPPNVEAAIDQALAKAPADRFVTAEQFVEALSAERLSITEHSAVWKRRLTGPVLVSIGVVAVVTGWMLVAWPFSQDPEQPWLTG
jgi:serine/threonine-protein kinase